MSSNALLNWTGSSDEDDNEGGAVLMSSLHEYDVDEDDTSQLLNYRVENRTRNRNPIPLSSSALERIKEEKKYKYSLVSVLIIGVCLLLMVNIGLGYRKCEGQDGTSKHKVLKPKPQATVCRDNITKVIFPWQQYRLPSAIKPHVYSIFLHPNLTTFDCTGHINITFEVQEETNHIIFHSGAKLQLFDIYIVLPNKKHIKPASKLYCEKNEMVALKFSNSLAKGSHYLLHIKFSYKLDFSLKGFYLSRYKKSNGKEMVIATTQFETVDARKAFPCFDEPIFKVNVSLQMVRDKHYQTLFNMPLKSTASISNNLEIDDFYATPKMSSYLIAFIVSDFQSVTNSTPSGIKVSVYASADKMGQLDFALKTAVNVLDFYEKFFKIPFPLEKMDLVAIPDFAAGAMENWGLITYRETAILYDPLTSGISDKEWVAIVIAHEISHQWFGNLVTMEWWNDLWLNEGFATYMEYFGTNGIYPQWNIMSEFPVKEIYAAMGTDVSRYTHPISVTVDSSEETREIFDVISYEKGGSLISMMSDFFGEAFFQGVTAYLNAHAYGNAGNQDLIASVANAAANSKVNVQAMMDTWTIQPGFPVVTVTSSGHGKVTVSQKRFLYTIGTNEQQSKEMWQIPLSYISDKNTNDVGHFVLDKKLDSIEVDFKSWIKFNHNETGYYLVTYDKKLWKSLTQQLKSDPTVFTPNDRVGLLGDSFAAAHSGQLTYDELFDLVQFVRGESEYVVLYKALGSLTYIKDTLKFHLDESSHSLMKSFLIYLLQPIYDKIAWKDASKLTREENKLKTMITDDMCKNEHQPCIVKALQLFDTWKQNHTAVSPNDLETVFYAAVAHGPSANWNYLWNLYVNSTNPGLKRKILGALTSSNEVDHVLSLQGETLTTTNIRSQDSDKALAGLAQNLVGSALTWKFVRQNWDELLKLNPVSSYNMQRIIKSCLRTLTDENDISAAKGFFEAQGISDMKFVKRDLESVQINIHWLQNYHSPVKSWLGSNKHQWQNTA
uniref:Endoplasmic reticulum aminopeptidase 2-like n=1 Tax=Phallusia mammillata TaxID=59560 RepID=A0A6F9DBJ2_9ASCI|nr:endoplasmic reticulum aminopeptidase 2-like [Phallusia mammillata]